MKQMRIIIIRDHLWIPGIGEANTEPCSIGNGDWDGGTIIHHPKMTFRSSQKLWPRIAVKCIKSVAVDTQGIRLHHAAQQRVAFHALVGQTGSVNVAYVS